MNRLKARPKRPCVSLNKTVFAGIEPSQGNSMEAFQTGILDNDTYLNSHICI